MKKNNKKITLIIVLALLLGIGSCSLTKEQDNNINVQDIDYLTCVTGLRDWTVEVGTEKVDYLDGVQWVESYVKEVTVDDSLIDLSQVGTYELIYIIHAVDETVQDVQKKVIVKVLAKEDVEEMVSNGQEIVTNDGIQNKVEVEAPKEEDIKTEDGGKVEKPAKPSKPEDPKEPSKPVDKPEKPVEPEKPEEPEKPVGPVDPEKPVHTHKWEAVYKTVHHDELGHMESVLVKEAWDEEVPVYGYEQHQICNLCGEDLTPLWIKGEDYFWAHLDAHMDKGETAGYHSQTVKVQTGTEVVHHEAVYKDKYVVDKPAWDEQVVDYYKCSCGETKH